MDRALGCRLGEGGVLLSLSWELVEFRLMVQGIRSPGFRGFVVGFG